MWQNKYSRLIVGGMIFLVFITLNSFAQEGYKWDKELVQKVEIRDKKIIDQLIFELFIPEADVQFIEIFDVDGNGAAEGDLLKTHPSRNVYPLYMLTKESRDILTGIPLPPNIEDIGLTVNINNPESASERILFILASTIKELYSQDKPLKLYFEQNEDMTYRFEFFGYNPDDLKDKEVSLGKSQTQRIHDLLKALYKEFNQEFVDWQPAVIHVVKTERDTFYLPESNSKRKKK
jgi:hypothetical protein